MQRQTQLVIVLVLVVLVIGAAFWFSKTESTGSAAEATATTVEQTDVGGEASGETVREVLEVEAPAAVSVSEVRIQVVEASSRTPLADATVHAFGDVETNLGTSDDEGLIVVERSLLEGRDVVCRKEGYAPERIAAPRSRLGEEIVVELAPLVALEGRIVVVRDDTIPVGLTVVAWPEHEQVPWMRTRAELLADPYGLSTESDADGAFTLFVRAGTFYSLAAGGKGWASISTSARAGGRTAELLVHRAYAIALRFTEVGGAPLELSPAFGGRNFGTPRMPEELRHTERLKWGAPGTALNEGLQTAIELARSEPWYRVPAYRNAFRWDEPILDVLEGGWLDIEWPGYEPKRVSFDCGRLAVATEIVTVELVRTADGFGSLDLEVDAQFADALLLDDNANAVLVDTTSGVEFFLQRRLAVSTETRLTWKGIPASRYRVRYATSSNTLDADYDVKSISGDDEIDIASGVTTRARVDMEGRALVLIEPTLDGRPYAGTMTVNWIGPVKPPHGQWRSVRFVSPPYALALTADRYELVVTQPFGIRGNEGRPSAELDLAAGATELFEVQLQRRP